MNLDTVRFASAFHAVGFADVLQSRVIESHYQECRSWNGSFGQMKKRRTGLLNNIVILNPRSPDCTKSLALFTGKGRYVTEPENLNDVWKSLASVRTNDTSCYVVTICIPAYGV